MNNYIVFGSPLINNDEIEEVVDTLRSGWLGSGPKVKLFENNYSRYKSVKHAVAVNSCTAALHLSLVSLNLNPGDEVITTPMTFCATVNAIIHSGATPVLADIEPDTLNIDPLKIERAITDRTKCILPVHFAGRPCNMEKIMKIAKKNNLQVIEDCAHAIETEYHGKSAGTFGYSGCFSFYVTKNVVTGEGGMVICDDSNVASRLKTLALHGLSQDAWKRFSDDGYKHYFVEEPGFKYNMMDIQAAIGIHQMNRIDENWNRRKLIWDYYNDNFSKLPIGIPSGASEGTKHAYHLYTIRVKKNKKNISRDRFLNLMHQNQIGTGVHYQSIPTHPFYRNKYGWNPGDFPVATEFGLQTASLPLSPKLSDNDIERVVETVKKIFS